MVHGVFRIWTSWNKRLSAWGIEEQYTPVRSPDADHKCLATRKIPPLRGIDSGCILPIIKTRNLCSIEMGKS